MWGYSNVLSLKVKLPEYKVHHSLLSIEEEVSTLIQMDNQKHIRYCLNSFSITILHKLCKGMPHTAMRGRIMAFTKSLACITFGARTEFLTNCANLTNFWKIFII
jgi:hypothetical protein